MMVLCSKIPYDWRAGALYFTAIFMACAVIVLVDINNTQVVRDELKTLVSAACTEQHVGEMEREKRSDIANAARFDRMEQQLKYVVENLDARRY